MHGPPECFQVTSNGEPKHPSVFSADRVNILNDHQLLFCFKIGRETDKPEQLDVGSVCTLRYGIGGLGSGSTPQISDAQGGSGGVGISSPFPCRDGEQLGSLVGSHIIQRPVKVSLLG